MSSSRSALRGSIFYYIGVNGGEQQMTVALGQAITVAPRGSATFQVSPSFQSVGVVTSYGNVWWNSVG